MIFLGDTHGDQHWTRFAIDQAKAEGCDVIMQVGDFGYWEHYEDGKRFLDDVSAALVAADIDLVWLDGNHENHTVLRANYGPEGGRYDPTPEGFWTIRPRVLHAPRGHRWVWSGRRFLALGGAYSIDKNRRREGASWWPEETITEGEVRRAVEGGQADVMVTHDAPEGVRGVMGWATAGDKDSFPESMANRKRLRAVFDVVMPSLLVHGHYHHRNTTRLMGCRVEGLGRDGDPDSMLVIDLDSYLVDVESSPVVERHEQTTPSGLVIVTKETA